MRKVVEGYPGEGHLVVGSPLGEDWVQHQRRREGDLRNHQVSCNNSPLNVSVDEWVGWMNEWRDME